MAKPILPITITTAEGKSRRVSAVFDSGSFYTILRADRIPAGAKVLLLKEPQTFRAAAKGTSFTATAELPLVLTIGRRRVHDVALVSSQLSREMLVGAGTMQKWDISITTRKGRTQVSVGRDMQDPDITEVVEIGCAPAAREVAGPPLLQGR
jgi:hypothetical protein